MLISVVLLALVLLVFFSISFSALQSTWSVDAVLLLIWDIAFVFFFVGADIDVGSCSLCVVSNLTWVFVFVVARVCEKWH